MIFQFMISFLCHSTPFQFMIYFNSFQQGFYFHVQSPKFHHLISAGHSSKKKKNSAGECILFYTSQVVVSYIPSQIIRSCLVLFFFDFSIFVFI